MLSRRDKLLVQPWENRRFLDHRSKVLSALPAIDDRAPAARPHVTVKLKACQRETERRRRVTSDNQRLLQRLTHVMTTKRLDNCWPQPLPNFCHKVGVFYDAETLRQRIDARALTEQASEESYVGNLKCFACDNKKKTVLQLNKVYGARADSLPSI